MRIIGSPPGRRERARWSADAVLSPCEGRRQTWDRRLRHRRTGPEGPGDFARTFLPLL